MGACARLLKNVIHRAAEKGSSRKLTYSILNKNPHCPSPKGIVAIIICAGRARGLLSSLLLVNNPAITPRHRTGRGLCCGKGFGKTMNTVYAIIYLVAASVMIVTVAFLVVVTALTS